MNTKDYGLIESYTEAFRIMDKISMISWGNDIDNLDSINEFVHEAQYIIGVARSILRGGAIGAGIGGIAGLVNGDISNSINIGIAIGAGVDISQYVIRFFYSCKKRTRPIYQTRIKK